MGDYITYFGKMLKQVGVNFAFGITGSGSSLKLITALEGEGIPYFPVAHEASAAIMAGACCRNGKTEAVALTIKGPGFANLIPGILCNSYEGRPALTISEAYGPNIPQHRKHKRMNHYSACGDLVKVFASVTEDSSYLPQLVDFAGKEVPGPVHIELFGDPDKTAQDLVIPEKTVNLPLDMEQLLKMITQSSKPTIVLGAMVSRNLPGIDWAKMGVPVVTTAAAKGCIDEFSPFSSGIITGEIKELSPESVILYQSDLVIAFGLRNTEVIQARAFAGKLILIDIIEGDLHEGFNPDLKIICTHQQLGTILDEVSNSLTDKYWGEADINNYRERLTNELMLHQWLPPIVFKHMQQELGKDVALVLDTGFFCTVGETVWKAATPGSFCGSSIGRFMGTAIPTSIGVSLSNKNQLVVCVAGDGGIRPYLPEIRLAIEENLPIMFTLMSDGLYGSIASGSSGSRHAVSIRSPQWWSAVQNMGCPAFPVSNLTELQQVLTQWKKSSGPVFVEMKFAPEPYSLMTNKLR